MREDKGGGGGGGEEERVIERKRRERRAFIHLGVTNVALGPSVNHRHSLRFSASHLVIGVCHRVRVVDHDHPGTKCRKGGFASPTRHARPLMVTVVCCTCFANPG